MSRQDDAFRITCQSPDYFGKHIFTYAPTRGVLSIDSSLVGGSGRSYEFRSRHGLFSPGSTFLSNLRSTSPVPS